MMASRCRPEKLPGSVGHQVQGTSKVGHCLSPGEVYTPAQQGLTQAGVHPAAVTGQVVEGGAVGVHAFHGR